MPDKTLVYSVIAPVTLPQTHIQTCDKGRGWTLTPKVCAVWIRLSLLTEGSLQISAKWFKLTTFILSWNLSFTMGVVYFMWQSPNPQVTVGHLMVSRAWKQHSWCPLQRRWEPLQVWSSGFSVELWTLVDPLLKCFEAVLTLFSGGLTHFSL